MIKKKIDPRIRTQIENGTCTNQRSIFIIIGDYSREQIVNIYNILCKTRTQKKPSILWCYKKELGFTSNRIKRKKKLRIDIRRGIREQDEETPFEIFINTSDIRYVYYKESYKVLGQTFGICIQQDFEAITPNILARTIETVEGGGIIIFQIQHIDSLKKLYTLSMDIHNRYRMWESQIIINRFNERFIQSLLTCPTCIITDDELNILPVSTNINSIIKIDTDTTAAMNITPDTLELQEQKSSLYDTKPIGSQIQICYTLDQAKCLLKCIEIISEKSLLSIVTILASRGRGKSAALGISLACSIAYGYSNIFITSPTPENVNTVFTMAIRGLQELEYKEFIHYEVVKSSDPDLNNAIIRINIFRHHRQTLQYVLYLSIHCYIHCYIYIYVQIHLPQRI